MNQDTIDFLNSPRIHTTRIPGHRDRYQKSHLYGARLRPEGRVPKRQRLRTFENRFKAVMRSAADGDARFYICGVLVDREHGTLVATDGYRVVRLQEPDIPDAYPSGIVSRDGTAIDAKYPDVQRLGFDRANRPDDIVLEVSLLPLLEQLKGAERVHRFIDQSKDSRVVPVQIEGRDWEQEYSLLFLLELVTLFYRLGHDRATFRLSASAHHEDPMLVEAPWLEYVLMPRRPAEENIVAPLVLSGQEVCR
jgi:hypothetical protein